MEPKVQSRVNTPSVGQTLSGLGQHQKDCCVNGQAIDVGVAFKVVLFRWRGDPTTPTMWSMTSGDKHGPMEQHLNYACLCAETMLHSPLSLLTN